MYRSVVFAGYKLSYVKHLTLYVENRHGLNVITVLVIVVPGCSTIDEYVL